MTYRPESSVKRVVGSLLHESKVRRVVVSTVLVSVMDDFVALKRSSEDPLDDNVVEVPRDRSVGFSFSASAIARIACTEDEDVPVRVDVRTSDRFYPTFSVKAPERLGRSFTLFVTSDGTTSMTVSTFANLRISVRLASFRDGRFQRRGVTFEALKLVDTSFRAGKSVGSRRRYEEVTATDFAFEFDRHDSILPLVTTEGKKND